MNNRGRWWICGLLLLATILNYLDRQVLSLTADRIIDEFGLTKEGYGHIIAAFRYSYAAVQIGGGWLVDTMGPRALFPAAVGLWSLAGMATALAGSVTALASARFVLGIGEAFNWPCALKTTERLLEPKDRPLANGIFNSGTAVGAMLAPVIVTFLAVRYGWRTAFVVTGALGFLWVVLWLGSTRPYAKQMRGQLLPASRALPVLIGIARLRAFWTLAASAVIVNGVSYFLADWIPLYLKSERGFSFGTGNLLSILVYAGLDAGNLIAGFSVRRLAALGWTVPRARHTTLLASCVLMSCAAPAGLVGSRWLALLFLALTAVGVAGFLVIYLTLVQEVAPAHIGACSGMLGGLGNLAYGLVSPYVGRLSDLGQTTVTFAILGALPWLAFASIRFGARESH